jgi:hypothetical protein
MTEKKPTAKAKRSRASAGSVQTTSSEGDTVTEPQDQSPAAASETISGGTAASETIVESTAAVDRDRTAMRPRQNLAKAAFALSLVGIVAAFTVPVWSPFLYGNPDSSRFVALGVAQLRPALERDAPFGAQLSTLRRVIPDSPELAKALGTIAVFADKGAMTLPDLRDNFNQMANEIMLGDVVRAKRSWLDRAVVKVAATLELHEVAHRLNDPREPSAVVWDAQTHLAAGDLAGAVDVLQALSGRPAEIAQPWIEAAHERLAADKVLAQLDSLATQLSAGALPKSVSN